MNWNTQEEWTPAHTLGLIVVLALAAVAITTIAGYYINKLESQRIEAGMRWVPACEGHWVYEKKGE